MRRRAREYDEYRTVLRGSGTRGGLRGSDPKKGIFEYDEYRTVLGERDQKASTSAFSRVQRYPVKRPYSIEYRCYSETAARLRHLQSLRALRNRDIKKPSVGFGRKK